MESEAVHNILAGRDANDADLEEELKFYFSKIEPII